MEPTTPAPNDRPGITYTQAKALLEELGVIRSIRTLQRWKNHGILTVKRITAGTVILFRDEVEALARKPNPYE